MEKSDSDINDNKSFSFHLQEHQKIFFYSEKTTFVFTKRILLIPTVLFQQRSQPTSIESERFIGADREFLK